MEITIQTAVGGPLDVNTYIASLPGSSSCVLVDPGCEPERVLPLLGERQVDAILLTHAHFDHIMHLQDWPDVPVYMEEHEVPALNDPFVNMSLDESVPLSICRSVQALRDGDNFTAAGIPFKVLHTPGHTVGSCCYLTGDDLFSGDTLFRHGYGRMDLPGGSPSEMIASLRRLFHLPLETRVYPGHGAMTTIRYERGGLAP